MGCVKGIMGDKLEAGDNLVTRLADAHAHPQMDREHIDRLKDIRAWKIAVMGVNSRDWEHVKEAHALLPHKVVPAFGVHPWWAHLHASSEGGRVQDLLEGGNPEEYGKIEEDLSHKGESIVGFNEWHSLLTGLLVHHPSAIVGEIGLDRAAVIKGTKSRPRYNHQMALLRLQLNVAVQLQRPVSIHCVRSYGHLLELFFHLSPEQCPPRVMLHSYGGNVEEITKFLKIRGTGPRFYFGFSHVINSRTHEKLLQRVRLVPDDRLLLESDHVAIGEIDGGLVEICQVVAEAKGWTLEETAERTRKNFCEFYDLK